MQTTLKNRTIFCSDNLDVLQGFNDTSVDLIYLDPPFNKNKLFSAPLGSKAEGAEFKDYWERADVKLAWLALLEKEQPKLHALLTGVKQIGLKGSQFYLIYMAIRLLELRRILKKTGSLYLHCDPTMSHYLKLVLDTIFGVKNFRNEVVWKKTNSPKKQAKSLGEQHDLIFFYTKSEAYFFKKPYSNYTEKQKKAFSYVDEKGSYQTVALLAGKSQKAGGRKEFEFRGVRGAWLYSLKNLAQFWQEGRIHKTKQGNYRLKSYLEESKGALISDLWIGRGVEPIQSHEDLGYPTQKPLSLMERIVAASSKPGDLVLDPFCGCATTCVAAEKLGRRWVGIDVSKRAYHLVKFRLRKEVEKPDQLGWEGEAVIYRDYENQSDLLQRTDLPEAPKLQGKCKKEIKQKLYGRQGGFCAGCEEHFKTYQLEIDHRTPKAKGGGDQEENLQLLCSFCNRVKGNRELAYLKSVLRNLTH